MKRVAVNFIAWVEILGGVFGVLLTIYAGIKGRSQIGAGYVLLLAMFIGLYAFTAMSGYWLLTGEKRGLRFSRIIQLIQIPQIFSSVFVWMFAAGLNTSVLISEKGISFNIFAGSRLELFIMRPGIEFVLGLNIAAVIFFVILISCRTDLPNNQQ